MKYKYLYQTKENENREGWIDARDRADAYTRLRKQGIRPYRVIGKDPVRWRPWAVGGAFAVLLAISGTLLLRPEPETPVSRRQLTGNSEIVSKGMADGWEDVFATKLDRYLAAYAQPGWIALPPETTDAEIAAFADELARPFEAVTDTPEALLLKRIVAAMRAEMADYLAKGGSVRDYLAFLEDRQDQEREFRNKAMDAIARAPESMRERVRMNVDMRLREMGLPPVGN